MVRSTLKRLLVLYRAFRGVVDLGSAYYSLPMFSFFKRRPDGSPDSGGQLSLAKVKSSQSGGRAGTNASATRWQEPIPVPEAQDADWAMWEDSVSFQESQITEYEPTEPAPIVPIDAAEGPGHDPFANVHKHSG